MSQDTLFDKVWDLHKVASLPGGSDQLFIGLHLIHEVTSPQAFGALKDKNLKVKFPTRTVATVDHIVPTDNQSRPFKDNLAEQMIETLEKNCLQHKIKFFNIGSGNQGIVHVVAPELGLTQPGMTIACGDSHTSTHGAFGSIAFGIGTSQVRDVLATQTIAMNKLNAPKNEHWDRALRWWESLKSDENSIYDDVIKLDASMVEPTVTWGITPGQSISLSLIHI